MELDGVEIKANVAEGDAVRDAIELLDLREETELQIWFHERVTTGVRLPLLEAGIAIRLRVESGEDDGECTVKLRPCDEAQLTPAWVAAIEDFDEDEPGDLELKAEEDWSGDRHVLAVSATATVSAEGAGDLLTEDQARFLAECGTIRVVTSELTRLGPIAATKWGKVKADALDGLKARAERWTVEELGLDFLEVSVKADDADEAEEKQTKLLAALAEIGIQVDASQETKTRRVLTALSR